MDGRSLQSEQFAILQTQLSAGEMQRFERFRRPQRRRQYLLGRALLRQAIGHAAGVPSFAVSIIERPGLGPALILPEGVAHPGFSLSHSRHWVSCAVGPCGAVGLDIEAIDSARDVLQLSEASFHPAEHAWLCAHAEDERVAAFYRLWTLKEALFKLLSNRAGQGEPPPLVDGDGGLILRGEDWLAASHAHQDLSITVCAAHSLGEIKLIAPSALVAEVR